MHLRQALRRPKKLWMSWLRNPKLATIGQGRVYVGLWSEGMESRELSWYPLPLANLPRQLCVHTVAREVARHRDTPNFCVCVIFDIYQAMCMFQS